MAGKIIKATSASITAASATGYLTLGAGTIGGFYERAVVNVTNTGQEPILCRVTEVLTGTNQIGVVAISEPGKSDLKSGLQYGRSNLSAYNGGTVYLDEQFIYNRNDKPMD